MGAKCEGKEARLPQPDHGEACIRSSQQHRRWLAAVSEAPLGDFGRGRRDEQLERTRAEQGNPVLVATAPEDEK